MSYKVTEEVLERSRSRCGARTLALAIAEVAHHDGVGWMRQGSDHKPLDPRTLRHRTNLSERQVGRCVEKLQRLDELEVVWARDGRRRFYVYRLIVGRLRDLEVDYERGLPQLVGDRFWTPEELLLEARNRPLTDGHVVPWSALVTSRHFVGSSDGPRPDISGSNKPTIATADDPTIATAHARASELTALREPPLEPSWTSGSEEPEVASPEGAATAPGSVDDGTLTLVRAFARTVGRWPDGRGEWGGWARAFKPLADQGISAQEVEVAAAAYLDARPGFDFEHPFALTLAFEAVKASLERSYLGFVRWAEHSWRLDQDEVAWIIASSARLTLEEKQNLYRIAAGARRDHQPDEITKALAELDRRLWRVA